MKYAVTLSADQTYVFLDGTNFPETGEGGYTTVHAEAKLWDTYEEALVVGLLDPSFLDVMEIPDVEEFKSRKDTW